MTEVMAKLSAALADRYTIERELGEGGMAIVYLAKDLKHNRKVAIKVFKPEVAEQMGKERFLLEIETAASLNHPHILTVHDSGAAEGLLYYVMPFVDGESLRDRIDREKQLPIEDTIQIAQEVSNALSYAHAQGVVHRDIKPENILMYSGHAVIADFGIAKAVSEAGRERLTSTGMAVGTPTYMSPEQASGEDVDSRSDIYAVGCLVYEMFVGEPPFTGSTVSAIVSQHVAAPPPSASLSRSTVNEGVSQAIMKAMAKTPADRYSKASDFAAALKSATGAPATTQIQTAASVGSWVSFAKILGGYLMLIAIVFMSLSFLVDRLVLSPHLPSFGFVALLSLIPTAAIVAFMRSPASRTNHSWLKKYGIPANIGGSALLLVLMFGTKDLGAATTSVVVEDEDGNAIERVVPKSEFRKRVALFTFSNETGDSTNDWLQYAFPLAVEYDLIQDLFVQTSGSGTMGEDLRRAGFPKGVGVPLTLMRQLASDYNHQYFVTGSFQETQSTLEATVRLYETRRTRLIGEQSVSAPDVFSAVDQICVALKHDLGLPSHHIEEVEDLPVAERLTSSLVAFEQMVNAYEAVAFDQDWLAGSAAIKASVETDPTNAAAHSMRYNISVMGNDQASAGESLEAAMQRLYKLPERSQYMVKFQYYDYSRQAEKADAVLKMWIELIPDDVEGRELYARILALRDRRPEAIEQYASILEIDPNQTQHLRTMGNLAQSLGEFGRAEEYFERYAEEYPDSPESFLELGQLLRLQGRFDEARVSFDRALLAEPDNVNVLVALAGLEQRTGNVEGAISQTQSVIDRAKTTQDSIVALLNLANLHRYRGQIRDAIAYSNRMLELSETNSAPLAVLRSRLDLLDDYVAIGQVEEAWQMMYEIEGQIQAPFDQIAAIGYLNIALEQEDPDSVDSAADRIQGFIDAFGAQSIQPMVDHARGLALEMREDFDGAIEVFQRELVNIPSDIMLNRSIGRCLRRRGDLDEAEGSLEKALASFPFNPSVHYELALVKEARGDNASAIQHLETALETWATADPEFEPAREAREKLAELQGR